MSRTFSTRWLRPTGVTATDGLPGAMSFIPNTSRWPGPYAVQDAPASGGTSVRQLGPAGEMAGCHLLAPGRPRLAEEAVSHPDRAEREALCCCGKSLPRGGVDP